jgi:hypothetical protein
MHKSRGKSRSLEARDDTVSGWVCNFEVARIFPLSPLLAHTSDEIAVSPLLAHT